MLGSNENIYNIFRNYELFYRPRFFKECRQYERMQLAYSSCHAADMHHIIIAECCMELNMLSVGVGRASVMYQCLLKLLIRCIVNMTVVQQ